jgi:hypothetical protein
MQRNFLIVAGILLALGGAARAEAPDGPRRSYTFTTEDDVTRMDTRAASDRAVVYILRGTQNKEAEGTTTLAPPAPEPAPAAAEPAPEKKKHRRGWNRN